MNTLKFYMVTFFIICSVPYVCNAQIDYNQRNTQASLDVMQYSIKNNHNSNKNAKGSPFINETFEVLKFKKFGNKVFSGRYDANLGEMQIRRENDTIALNANENFEITFVSSNKTYKTLSYIDNDGISKRGFLVVLNETDSIAVLKEEVIKFHEEKPSTNGYDKSKPAEYKRVKDNYYYKIGEHVSVLPQKRKEFTKLFPEHSKKLEVFIKKNKISLKKEDELISLFKHIGTL